MKRTLLILLSLILMVQLVVPMYIVADSVDYHVYYELDSAKYRVDDIMAVDLYVENNAGEKSNIINFTDWIVYNKSQLELIEVTDIAEDFVVSDKVDIYNDDFNRITARYQHIDQDKQAIERDSKFKIATIQFKVIGTTTQGIIYHDETRVWEEAYKNETITTGNANFESVTKGSYYKILTSCGSNGTITESQEVAPGGEVTINIAPSSGYRIGALTVDGEVVTAKNEYTFSDVNSDHAINVEFQKTGGGGGGGGGGGSTNTATSTPKPTETADPSATARPDATAKPISTPSIVLPGVTESDDQGLPYYYQNNEKVFIGITAINNGKTLYIAPHNAEVSFTQNKKSFEDTAGHWAIQHIDFVTEREIFIGTEDNVFSPNIGMTRAMFVTAVGRMFERSIGELSVNGSNNFDDVDYSSWYGRYVQWASENGIVKGIGAREFAPDQAINRQEMSAILCRLSEALGKASPNVSGIEFLFSDKNDISSWATNEVKKAIGLGFINNVQDAFRPLEATKRSEAAAMIERFINSILTNN